MLPPVSVEAVQDRLIWTGPEDVAVRFDGAVGEFAGVVAPVVVEYELKLLEASVARTR
jgi:hypothetical protein